MNGIKCFGEKHPLLLGGGVLAANYIIVKTVMTVLKVFGLFDGDGNTDLLAREIVFFLSVMLMVKLTGREKMFACGRKNMLRALWSGGTFIVIAVSLTAASIYAAHLDGRHFKAPVEIAAFILFVCFVGAAEEILDRGIVAGLIIGRFGKTPKGTLVSVVLSGVMFGLAHITNVFNGQSLKMTMVQVVAASMMGMLFSAVYIRHRNIFANALLHALYDLSTMFGRAMYMGTVIADNEQDGSFMHLLSNAVLVNSFFVIAAVVVMRPYIRNMKVRSREMITA